MGDTAEMGRLLAELRDTQRAIGAATAARDEGWRLEVVRCRRQLAERIGTFADQVNRDPAPDTETVALRAALSSLRSALAEHQATWPAVSLDPDAAAYRASIERVRAAYAALDAAYADVAGKPAG